MILDLRLNIIPNTIFSTVVKLFVTFYKPEIAMLTSDDL